MACAAALEVQRVIRDDQLLDVRAMGDRLEAATERFGNHRNVGDIRGAACSGLEFVTDRGSKQVFDPALKLNEQVKAEAFAGGLSAIRWAARSTASEATITSPRPTSPPRKSMQSVTTAWARRSFRGRFGQLT